MSNNCSSHWTSFSKPIATLGLFRPLVVQQADRSPAYQAIQKPAGPFISSLVHNF